MSGFHIILAIVLLLGAEGHSQNSDPILLSPAQSVPAGSPDSCSTEEDFINVKNDLRESIFTSLNPGNYSCGGTSSWARVAYLDMTDPAQSCPPGWLLRGSRMCGRRQDGEPESCDSALYRTGGLQYSRVCGRIRAYQFGLTHAFRKPNANIESIYVDGVVLSHGFAGHRVHIWTFAAAKTEAVIYPDVICPCVTADATQPPPFVGDDYFCESGNSIVHTARVTYTSDPLFDGQDCTLSCCQQEYFTKTLPARTTDDIEIRICGRHGKGWLDVPVDQVEIYVQ